MIQFDKVKPTQQVPPNIQDQVDVTTYPTFVSALPAAISQASLQQQQQQQHLLSQAQVNPLHQPHSYPFYDSHLSLPQQPNQQQQQATFNRVRFFASLFFLMSSAVIRDHSLNIPVRSLSI